LKEGGSLLAGLEQSKGDRAWRNSRRGGIAAPLSNRGKKGGRREAGTWHGAWPSSKRRGVRSGARARERGLAAGSYA
jgi:hypothetical protein